MEKVARVSSFLNRYIEVCAMPIITNVLHLLYEYRPIGLGFGLSRATLAGDARSPAWPFFCSGQWRPDYEGTRRA